MFDSSSFRDCLSKMVEAVASLNECMDQFCHLYENAREPFTGHLSDNPDIDCPLVMIPGEDGAIVTSEPHTEAFDVPVVVHPPPTPTTPQIVYEGVGAASHGRIEYR